MLICTYGYFRINLKNQKVQDAAWAPSMNINLNGEGDLPIPPMKGILNLYSITVLKSSQCWMEK